MGDKDDIFGLAGKVALVTGAARNIGRAIAQGLARAGAAVALADLVADGVRDAAEEIARQGGVASWHQADVRSAEEVEGLFRAAVDRHGGLDILVAGAGVARRTRFAELSWEEWRETFAVNVDGVFRCCQAALQPMRQRGGGAIVVIGSVAAWTGGMKGLAAYSASKAAVLGLVHALARELAADRIRVNGIAPGLIDTDMLRSLDRPERLAGMAEQVPLRRLGAPPDLVGAAVYLASPASGYVTGTVLTVDGGLTMG